ncbi:MAG: hypothetical protein HY459_01850 [Parcubacteria group bacterium]|nr:hypothetical protein [Parcubacteria group bacterium]
MDWQARLNATLFAVISFIIPLIPASLISFAAVLIMRSGGKFATFAGLLIFYYLLSHAQLTGSQLTAILLIFGGAAFGIAFLTFLRYRKREGFLSLFGPWKGIGMLLTLLWFFAPLTFLKLPVLIEGAKTGVVSRTVNTLLGYIPQPHPEPIGLAQLDQMLVGLLTFWQESVRSANLLIAFLILLFGVLVSYFWESWDAVRGGATGEKTFLRYMQQIFRAANARTPSGPNLRQWRNTDPDQEKQR